MGLQEVKPMRAGATFVLSLDTEIAWGSFDTPRLSRFASTFDSYRRIAGRLVDLLDRFQIPATWAFVGHLLLDRCEFSEGTTHPEVLRPIYSWYPGEWHDHDPATSIEADPWWYGTDILRMVRSASVDHEIGCHTFSHVVFGDPACTAAIARSQLEACKRLHDSHGLSLSSLVFPRNRPAHLDIVAETGIIAYRGREQSWYEDQPPELAPAAHFLDRLLAFCPRTYRWEELQPDEHGLVNVPASMFLMPYDGIRSWIPTCQRVRQAKRGLTRAIRRGELFHLWFHPFNLGSSVSMFDALEAILETVDRSRSSGALHTATMAEVAHKRIEAEENVEEAA